MNKKQLIEEIAKHTNSNIKEAGEVLKAFTSSIEKSLKGGDSVKLIGFGTFSVTKRSAREGRNPQTGKTIQIPARRLVKFKPSKALNEQFN